MSLFSELASHSNSTMSLAKKQESPDPLARRCLSSLTRILDLDLLENFQDTTKNVAQNLETEASDNSERSSRENFFTKSSIFISKMISQNKQSAKPSIFGQPLTTESVGLIEQLIPFIYKHIQTEGLFRVSGSKKRQDMLRAQIDMATGANLECGMFTVHDVATVLKQFVGELPQPLIPDEHHVAHKQATELSDVEKYRKALQLLMLLLPPPNRALLEKTLQLLKTVAETEANKMTDYSLAVVFAPNILNLTQKKKALSCVNKLQDNMDELTRVVQKMIAHSEEIFKIPDCMQMEADMLKEGHLEQEDQQSQSTSHSSIHKIDSRIYREVSQKATADALAELFDHVSQMPDGPKKTKLLDRFQRAYPGTPPFIPRTKKTDTGVKNSTPFRSNTTLGPLGRTPFSPIVNSYTTPTPRGRKARFMRPPMPVYTPSGFIRQPSNMDISETEEENLGSPTLKSPSCTQMDISKEMPKSSSVFYTSCFEAATPTSSVMEIATPSGVMAPSNAGVYNLYGKGCKQAQRKTCSWDSEPQPSPIKL